ncbi:hypothetical protein MLD38_019289 [Melastoma candidum]|uniref:Uncharacterized protein n=1 Tax=Melastoma candidum TaxID=119954 RepID=A0ACB9QWG6_9MYRT|nr:hypothetical protein MLD38_019289 [Melastoma candidum]
MMYRQYENDILEFIVNSDNDVDTDEEMFNGVDLGDDEEGMNVSVNEAGPFRKRLEKSLPFYLDSGDTGKMIVDEDEDVRIRDNTESVVKSRKGMRFKNKKELIKTVNTFCIKNHYNYEVIETDKIRWYVICSENGGGCKWRLRGRQRSGGHEFEITVVDATEEVVQMYSRAYILQLIGGMLFTTKSDNLVHLFWLPLLADFEMT